ncbi:MAG: hypothetical protein KKC77_11690 [Proteobacteria bacterium]|nr:hypothetical protein [Pseudomonadota bacterium]
MNTYFSAYALTIQSDIDLLIPTIQTSSAPDITIHFGTNSDVFKNRNWEGVWYEYKNSELLHLKWDILGSYRIQSGKEILIHPNEPVNHDNIRQPILGTIMAMALQQRGCIALHGSAVLMDKQVTIFVANKGEGKSTIAAWLNSQGFPLLSDDVCAMDYANGQDLSIRPAFPKIRLNPDVLQHFGENPDHYPQVHPKVNKRILDMDEGFCSTAKPVGAICVLETGDEFKLEQLNGMDAVKEILTHMLINRFPENQPLDLREEIFSQVAYLTKSIPVYRLTRPRDLELLPETTSLLQRMAGTHFN